MVRIVRSEDTMFNWYDLGVDGVVYEQEHVEVETEVVDDWEAKPVRGKNVARTIKHEGTGNEGA